MVLTFELMISSTLDWMSASVRRLMWPLRTAAWAVHQSEQEEGVGQGVWGSEVLLACIYF